MTSGPVSAWVPEAFFLGCFWALVEGGDGSPGESPVGEGSTSSMFCAFFLSTSHSWNCFPNLFCLEKRMQRILLGVLIELG